MKTQKTLAYIKMPTFITLFSIQFMNVFCGNIFQKKQFLKGPELKIILRVKLG